MADSTSQSLSESYNQNNQGVAENLYVNILSLLTLLVNSPMRETHEIDKELREELGRLFLWGESFRGGKLDLILESYSDLRSSILRFLVALGKAIITKFSIPFPNYSHQQAAELVEKTKKSIDSVYPTSLNDSDDEDNMKEEVDSSSEASQSKDSDEWLESLQFYISLLMNLVPSMEQAYNQTLKELRGHQSRSFVKTSPPGAVEMPHSLEFFQSDISQNLHQNTNTSSEEVDAPKSRIIHDENSAKDLRNRFERLLGEKRHLRKLVYDPPQAAFESKPVIKQPNLKEALSLSAPLPSRPHSHLNASPSPPPYRSTQTSPNPTPHSAVDKHMAKTSASFRAALTNLSSTPLRWENPGLLDEALSLIPVDRIYGEAQDECRIFRVKAESLGVTCKAEWAYQDCVIRALTRWFKRSFFCWVDNPLCSVCHAPTVALGTIPPSPEEIANEATRVELYKCSDPGCGFHERFPRYASPWMLLKTRRGRVGEWNNCFGMLCRAIGAKVRWVWNKEDHVWTEVYSEHQRRWVHVDPCEEAWDNPRMYTEGWGRKLSYCIAFSVDGATDVTRRYVRDSSKYGLPRTRTSEDALTDIIKLIRSMKREKLSKEEKVRLIKEDLREEKEFQMYVIQALVAGLSASFSGNVPGPEDQKRLAEWGDSAVELRRTRGAVVSIVSAVTITMVGVGVSRPDDGHIAVTVETELVPGFPAVTNIIFAYAGRVAFFNFMAEMKVLEEYPKALYLLQGVNISMYLLVAFPALGSTSPLLQNIAYGIAVPTIVVAGVVSGHVAAKYIYVQFFPGTGLMGEKSVRSYGVWAAIVTGLWVVAEAVSVFK